MVLVFGWGIISRQRTGVLGEAAHGYKQPEQMHRVLDNPQESSESVSGIQWKQQQCGKASQLLKTVCYPNWNSVVNNGVSLCAKDRKCAVGAIFELMLAGTAANFFPNRAEPCFHHRKMSIGEDTSRHAVATGKSLPNGQFHREQGVGYAILLNNIHAVAVSQIQSRSAVQFQAKLFPQY